MSSEVGSGEGRRSDPRSGASGRVLDSLVRSRKLTSSAAQRLRYVPEAASRLVSEGLVSEADVLRARAEVAGLRYVERLPEPSDAELSRLAGFVPEKRLRRYGAVPVSGGSEEGSGLVVAVPDPSDFYAFEDLRIISGRRVSFVVAPEAEISIALERLFSKRASTPATRNEDSTVITLLDDILERAISHGASDVHLEPDPEFLKVRLRVDGVLEDSAPVAPALANALVTRVKVLASLDIAEKRVPQDGRFTFASRASGNDVDLRVATLPTTHGEGAVLRLLNRANVELDLGRLGFSGRDLAAYREVFSRPHGTVLVTGPTGSGKSTTLYATLAGLNSPEKKIITIEDPIEYRIGGLTQIQVNPRAGLTFASGLRSILRADPDILMVGEVRDHETARIAIEAALTGHLVFATLHTNDAPSALTRLTDMGVEPYLSASSVDSVIAQRLARRLCGACKRPVTPTKSELEGIVFPFEAAASAPAFFAPVGCNACGGTGYRGRIGVYEIMHLTEEMASLVVSRASAQEIGRAAENCGMLRLRTDGLLKAAAGITSIEEVLRTTV